MIRRFWSGLLITFSVISLGCATRPETIPEAPVVTISNLRLAEVGLLEQRYSLDLRVQNPNASSLSIIGMNYLFTVNGKPFARGVNDRKVQLKAFGETVIPVEIVGNTGQTLEQLKQLTNGEKTDLEYELSGRFHLDGPNLQLPFTTLAKTPAAEKEASE